MKNSKNFMENVTNMVKSQKGSMAVYAIVTFLAFTIILTGLFLASSSVRKNQLKTLPKIKEAYERALEDKQEIYEERLEKETLYTLTIKYQKEDGSLISEDVVKTFKVGEKYSVPSPEIEGYTPNTDVVSGTMPNQNLEIIVYYAIESPDIPPITQKYTLTIKYQNEDGVEVYPQFVGEYSEGDSYSIESPTLEGTYTVSDSIVFGTMPGMDVEYIVIYIFDDSPPL